MYVLVFSFSAAADWGTGQYGATNCNQPYEPAPQSYAASDELANIRGQMSRDSQALRQKEADLNRIHPRIDEARRRMRQVVSPEAMTAVEEHHAQRRDRNAYREQCGPNPGGDANQVPVPQGFCHETAGTPPEYENDWDAFYVHPSESGRVTDAICKGYAPRRTGQPAQPDQEACLAGLRDFYAAMEDRRRLNDEIADLRARVKGYESQIGRITTEVSEGRYCATCTSERRGYSTNSTGDQTINMIQPLIAMGAALLSRSQQQQRQPPPMIAGGPQPYRAYPARPYAARMPGYNGVHNGVYGGVPGSIGRGAFACNNTSPMAFGDPMFGNDIPSIFGGPSPINAPYAAPFMNPTAQNRLFNSGFGPSFSPRLGGNAPLVRPYQQAFNRPGAMPWQNRLPQTQMPNRFGLGNAPVTAPWVSRPGGGQFAGTAPMFPGYPQASLLGQYGYGGGTQFYNAPAVAGYGGGPLTSVSNVPNLQNNILGNYSHQMNQIANSIQLIGSGRYYTPPAASAPTVVAPGGGAAAPTAPTDPTVPRVIPPVKKK